MKSFNLFFRQHPSFKNADEFKLLCEPLRHLGINHFSHIRVNADGTFNLMSLNPVFLKHYLESSYYHFDIFQLNPKANEQYLLRDLQSLTGSTKKLQQDFNAHGFGHSFTITNRSNKNIDFYNFASKFGNTSINEQYLLKLDQLKLFISYYHDKVNGNKDLSEVYKYHLDLRTDGSEFQLKKEKDDDCINLDSLNRIYIPTKQTFLTLREFECLSWLAKGKTQDQIAAILNISLRTVKAHVLHVREKLQCVNQFQLGMIYAQIPTLLNQF